jgi:RNA polymerase sigma-70 factor, ECF subfamily
MSTMRSAEKGRIPDLSDLKDHNGTFNPALKDTHEIDRQILEFYQKGEREQGLKLITQYYQSRLYALTYRMTGNHDEAMDALQEILIQVDRSIGSFRGDSSIYTWLYRLTSNVCLNHAKKSKRHNTTASWDEVFLNSVLQPQQRPEENPDRMCETRFRQHLVEQALQRLPEKTRMIVVLHDLDGVNSPEIAKILSVTVPAVKSRLLRGRQALKRLLSEGIELEGYQSLGIIKFSTDQLD